MNKIRTLSACLILFAWLYTMDAAAGWVPSGTVASGGWGNSDNRFGKIVHDSGEETPEYFCVTNQNYVVVADSINSRIKVYKNGLLTRMIFYKGEEKLDGWPHFMWCLNENIAVSYGSDFDIYDVNGNLIKRAPADSGHISRVGNGFLSKKYSDNEYRLFNSSGETIRKSMNEPLETGKHYSDEVIRYNDIVFRVDTRRFSEYFRDASGNINILSSSKNHSNDDDHGVIIKFNRYGQRLGTVELPQSLIIDRENVPLVTKRRVLDAVVSNDGDVYAAITSDASYKILKWKWQESEVPQYVPDAPLSLRATSLPNSLKLLWDPSNQDPGCVTGYEISRSDKRDGEYRIIAKAPFVIHEKDDPFEYEYYDTSALIGKTYYYKVRTVVDTLFSPYTEVVHGKRDPEPLPPPNNNDIDWLSFVLPVSAASCLFFTCFFIFRRKKQH